MKEVKKVAENYTITGIVVTAGFSSRMSGFKPLLKLHGRSFLNIIINNISTVCDEVIVVTGHNAHLIEKEICTITNKKNIKTVYNPNFSNGMFSSLQCGVNALANSNWVLYHFIDQPILPKDFYSAFINQIDNSYDWVQPNAENKNGHPILFSQKVAKFISNAPLTSNLKELTKTSAVKKKYWKCNYPEIFIDIDTDNNYQDILDSTSTIS